MVTPLDLFPGLAKNGFSITSPRTNDYNCVAWAAGDATQWWWPTSSDQREAYWPAGVERTESIEAFAAAFAIIGYVSCGTDALEPGFEKVALFASADGDPLHVARQLADGRWTSKIGELEDIEHALRDLEGAEYGSVALVMKRPTGVV